MVPASKPSSLTNCTLRTINNQTSETIEVECRAGYDGGLPQRFVLEAYDTHNMRLRLNQSIVDTDIPIFRLELGELLPSPASIRIILYAENAKGKSEKVVMDDILLNDAEKRTGNINSYLIIAANVCFTKAIITLESTYFRLENF